MPKKTVNILDKSLLYVDKELNESKRAERALKKVRKKAEKGKGDYKLTKPQLKLLREIEKKYGKNARKELENFRNQTLAPLHFVHKKTREGGLISTKDLVGLTKKEWERAVESGRNKIKKRGEISDRIKKDISAINYNKKSIEKLEKIKRMLSGKTKLDTNLVRAEIDRFIKNYGFLSGAKVEDLKQVQSYNNDIEKSWKNIEQELKKDQIDYSALTKEAEIILNKQHGYYSKTKDKKDIKDEKDKKNEPVKGYSEELNKAATNLFFRNNIVSSILSAGDNAFKSFYYTFLNKLINDAKKRIAQHTETLRRRGSDLEFNENERKVWGINKNAHPLSGNLNDYYLKIEEEDFEEAGEPKTIEQPEELKTSKKKIENERYNFLQRFKKRYNISDKDFDKIHDLGIVSFIDRDKFINLAMSKLEKKGLSKGKIKAKVDKIIKQSSNEKEIERKIEKLAEKTINKENVYDKAYKIFSGELDRSESKLLADKVIKKSKSEKDAEEKLKRLFDEKQKGKKQFETLKKSILGLDDE